MVRGRPTKGDEEGRNKLLAAAKQCFTELPYEQVTTRMLAERAGVNAALIRYYFINKDGLYREMFVAITDEVTANWQAEMAATGSIELEKIFVSFNRVIAKTPQFPLLMIKELILGEGRCRQFLIERMSKIHNGKFRDMLLSFNDRGILKEGVNIEMLHLTIVCLQVFPWHFRSVMTEMSGNEPEQSFYDQFAQHNAELLMHGCFKEGTDVLSR